METFNIRSKTGLLFLETSYLHLVNLCNSGYMCISEYLSVAYTYVSLKDKPYLNPFNVRTWVISSIFSLYSVRTFFSFFVFLHSFFSFFLSLSIYEINSLVANESFWHNIKRLKCMCMHVWVYIWTSVYNTSKYRIPP